MSDWEKEQSHNITLQIAQYVRAQSILQALWTILWRLWSGHSIGLNSPKANIYVKWNILERKAKIKVNKTLAHATALNVTTLLFTFILPVVPQKWHYQYWAWLLKSSFWSRLALDRELGANSKWWVGSWHPHVWGAGCSWSKAASGPVNYCGVLFLRPEP